MGYDFNIETPVNYANKTVCCLVVDVSGSMAGAPLNQLNTGLQQFHSDIRSDSTMSQRLEVAVITFGSVIEVVVPPSLADYFTMPILSTNGSTKLVDGVRSAMQMVDERKAWYKSTGQPYLRPWVILITDGAPDPDQDVNGLIQEIAQAEQAKKFVFMAIGVQGADMNTLSRLSVARPPLPLGGLKFGEFFQWLSASMAIIASSSDGDRIDLPDPAAWMTGVR
jgi:uncharacterized protein YegL